MEFLKRIIRGHLIHAFGLMAGVILVAQLSGWPEKTPPPSGPHGGSVFEDRYNRFEVKIDKQRGMVDVYALRMGSEPPQSLSVTLFKDPDNTQSVDLTAVHAIAEPYPHYQAQLSFAADKYMAVGVTFNVSLSKPTPLGAPG